MSSTFDAPFEATSKTVASTLSNCRNVMLSTTTWSVKILRSAGIVIETNEHQITQWGQNLSRWYKQINYCTESRIIFNSLHQRQCFLKFNPGMTQFNEYTSKIGSSLIDFKIWLRASNKNQTRRNDYRSFPTSLPPSQSKDL